MRDGELVLRRGRRSGPSCGVLTFVLCFVLASATGLALGISAKHVFWSTLAAIVLLACTCTGLSLLHSHTDEIQHVNGVVRVQVQHQLLCVRWSSTEEYPVNTVLARVTPLVTLPPSVYQDGYAMRNDVDTEWIVSLDVVPPSRSPGTSEPEATLWRGVFHHEADAQSQQASLALRMQCSRVQCRERIRGFVNPGPDHR